MIYIYKYFLLTFDDNYVEQAIGLMKSILSNTNENICFIVFSTSFNKSSLEKLESINIPIIIYYIDSKLFNYDNPIHSDWPIATMFRLIAPWIIEETMDYLYYLDCDMLCINDLGDLFKLKFNESIAMCFEVSGNIRKQCELYGNDSIYCNAGFLIYNMKEVKRKYNMNDMLNYLNSILDDLAFGDQDFLNLYYAKDTKYLNAIKYDNQIQEYLNFANINYLIQNTIFIHFSAKQKPWMNNCDLTRYNIYLKYSKYDYMTKFVAKNKKQYLLLKPLRLCKRILRKIYRIIFRKK